MNNETRPASAPGAEPKEEPLAQTVASERGAEHAAALSASPDAPGENRGGTRTSNSHECDGIDGGGAATGSDAPIRRDPQAVQPATTDLPVDREADEPGEVQALQPSHLPPPGSALTINEDALRLAEAMIFASADPVSARSLQRLLPDDIDAEAVLAALHQRYAGRGVELVEAGGGVMFRTAADLAPRLRKVVETPRRLPRVAMETLAIVAYHQPITRPEIEHIRGSALSQQTLDSLLELNLITPKGRRETPGRPTLWGTTPEFLAHFGLKDLRELPRREDLLLEPVPPRPETVTPDLQRPDDRSLSAGGMPTEADAERAQAETGGSPISSAQTSG